MPNFKTKVLCLVSDVQKRVKLKANIALELKVHFALQDPALEKIDSRRCI